MLGIQVNKTNNRLYLTLQIIEQKKDHDLAWDNKSTNINKTSSHLPPYLNEHKQKKEPWLVYPGPNIETISLYDV